MKRQTIKIFIIIFHTIILNGCGATLLDYKHTENPSILDAMKIIRNKIIDQPEEKAPIQIEVSESFINITDSTKSKFIYFKDISEVQYHTKRNWFMVSLVNRGGDGILFRYFAHSETDAKQFIDNIQTLINHRSSQHALTPDRIKKLLESLNSFKLNPDTQKFDIVESDFLSALNNIEQYWGENHIHVGRFTNSLAEVYQLLGKYEQAEPLYLRSLAIQKKYYEKDRYLVKGDFYKTIIFDNLTTLYAEQGRFRKAENFALKSLAIKEQGNSENISLVVSLDNLSSIHQAQGRYELADNYNQRSLKILEKNVNLTYHNELGSIASSLAENKITSATKETLGFVKGYNTVTNILSLAISAAVMSDYILDWFDVGMMAGSKREVRVIYSTTMAGIYQAQGKYTLAESMFNEVINIYTKQFGGDHPIVAKNLSSLSKNYYLQGKYKESIPLLHQAMAINEKKLGKQHPAFTENLNLLAFVYAAQNQHTQTKLLLQKSLRSTNIILNRWLWGAGEKTRLAYLLKQETNRDIYLSFYNLTNDPYEALYFSLSRKGILLRVSSIANKLAKRSIDPDIRMKTQELNALRIQLSTLYLTERADQVEIYALAEKINTVELQLSQMIGSIKLKNVDIAPAQVLKNLKSSESMVDFLVYKVFDFKNRKFKEEQVIALVANTHNGVNLVNLVNLGNLAPIAETIKSYRLNISKLNPLSSYSKTLFQQLWAPLAPYLQNSETVYVIPDGPLHLLPFTALQDQDGLYLTDKWHLITLYSPRDIVLTKKSNKTKTASAIFAAPDFGDINVQSKMAGLNTIHFSELPGTLIEGQQIKQLFTQKKSQSSVKLFLKKQATELKILNLTSPKILHIATHGFFLEDIVKDDKALERGLVKRSGLTVTPLFIQNPLARSGLAFSGANSGIIGNTRADNTDGILTALEALNLNLDGTDLVVLSACETGLGNIKIGEGVYSLNRSFQEAGAKMVLSTLWSVADEATGIFMTKFYDRFLDGKSAQKAIQETQNEFRHDKKYSHPFYWAGFVVTGK